MSAGIHVRENDRAPVLEGVFEHAVAFAAGVVYREAGGRLCRMTVGDDRAVITSDDGAAVMNASASLEPLPEGGIAITGPDLRLELRGTADAEGGLRVDLALTALSGPLALESVVPLAFGAGLPLLGALDRCRMLQHGYQGWTPCRSVPAASAPELPRLSSFALMNHYVDSPLWGRRNGLLSSQLAVLQRVSPDGAPEGDGLMLGFLAQARGLGEIFLRNLGRPALVGHLDFGGRRLALGERLDVDALLVARGPADVLLDRFAARAAAEMGAPASFPERSPAGWCSWYELYTAVREEDVRRNARAVAARPELGLGFVQLDDGYQAALGDWREVNAKFPAGLRALTAEIRGRGLGAGLWTAPLLCSLRSRLARENPAFLLRDARGRPVDCGFNPMWRERVYALDVTHPGAAGWLGETFAGLAEDGFDYFKVDFMFAGLRRGQRFDPGLSPVEAYRKGLAVIREAIGPGRFLLGCGAPMGPSVGFVDAMRISEDVKEVWAPNLMMETLGSGCGVPSARGAMRSTMTRSFLHRRFWLNDPDCLLVRRRASLLSQVEVEALSTVLGMSGGMLFLSDDMPALDADRLELARAVLPPSPVGAKPDDLMLRDPPTIYRAEGQARKLVGLVNWGDTAREMSLPADLAATGWHRHDFWRDALLPDDREGVRVERHGAAAVLATPRRHEPAVIGSSLHLMALIDGRLEDSFDPHNAELVIRGRDMARDHGSLWIAIPGDLELDRAALPREVTEATAWPGGVRLMLRAAPPWEIRLRFRPRGSTLQVSGAS